MTLCDGLIVHSIPRRRRNNNVPCLVVYYQGFHLSQNSCANEDQFVRVVHATGNKPPCVVLYDNRQMDDLKRFL